MASHKRQRVIESGSNSSSSGRHPVFIRTWGSRGTNAGQFTKPSAVAVGMDGTVYVGEHGHTSRIQSFTPDGTFLRSWGESLLTEPSGLAIGVRNGMKLSIFTAMRTIPVLAAFPPGVLPICVAYVGDECVYVSDFWENRMQAFSCDGQWLCKWGTEGENDAQFWRPTSCAAAMDGNVYVADCGNRRIQAFHSDGTFIRKWDCRGGNSDDRDWHPTSLSVNSDGDDGFIYVAEVTVDNPTALEQKSRIRCFRHHDGIFVREFPLGNLQLSFYSFWCPCVITVDDVAVYVVAPQNEDIYAYQKSDGTLIGKWYRPPGRGDGQLYGPRAITKGFRDGLLYIADSLNDRMVVINVQLLGVRTATS